MNRAKEIQATRLRVIAKHGVGAVISSATPMPVSVIPSGLMLLDLAMGIGGYPRGRLIEIFGPPSCGKSTMGLAATRECQALGEAVLYMDYENAFGREYAHSMGVDTGDDLFILSQPDHLEQGMAIAEEFVLQGLVGLVIVDSLAAMIPKAYLEGEIGDEKRMAEQARVMARCLQRLVKEIGKSQTAVIFINHVHTSIGAMPGRAPRRTTPGGDALKFYASMRIEIQPVDPIRGKMPDFVTGKPVDVPVAMKMRALVVKNKLAMPYREGRFYLRATSGIDEQQAVLEVAEGRGLIRRNGSRYILPFRTEKQTPVNLGGLQAVMDWFHANPEKFVVLQNKVKELISGQALTTVSSIPAQPTPDGAAEVEIGYQEGLDEDSADAILEKEVSTPTG